MKSLSFIKGSGVRQIVVKDAEDIVGLLTSDPRQWICMSAPVYGQRLDSSTMAFIDDDANGLILFNELKDTIRWVMGLVEDLSPVVKGQDCLELENLKDKALVACAQRVNDFLKKGDSTTICLKDVLLFKEQGDDKELLVLEKLLRYCRDLLKIINNFVSFPYFYNLADKASFQAGTLYLGGCSYQLSLKVKDVEEHAQLAEKSGIFVIYSVLRKKGSDEQEYIATAVTSKHGMYLTEGLNGVFCDESGEDWAATIVKVLRRPVSLHDAIFSPIMSFFGFIREQLKNLTSFQKKSIESSLEKAATGKNPSAAGSLVGAFTGVGIAVAALGSALAFITKSIASIGSVDLLYAILVIFGVIFVPSIFIGWVRLKSRDLGMLLQASGWAINRQMRVSRRLSKHLTKVLR